MILQGKGQKKSLIAYDKGILDITYHSLPLLTSPILREESEENNEIFPLTHTQMLRVVLAFRQIRHLQSADAVSGY